MSTSKSVNSMPEGDEVKGEETGSPSEAWAVGDDGAGDGSHSEEREGRTTSPSESSTGSRKKSLSVVKRRA
jgi:hypothetical protein